MEDLDLFDRYVSDVPHSLLDLLADKMIPLVQAKLDQEEDKPRGWMDRLWFFICSFGKAL